MTPAARAAAAIEVLDRWLAGMPAEQALTNWARSSRFAGSGDRHAVRDLVFQAIRCRRSHAAFGGAETGRGLILGGQRDRGEDPAAIFTGEGHAPAPLTDAERDSGHAPSGAEALDCPEWLWPRLQTSLGADAAPVMAAQRQRADVHLRVNSLRATPTEALAALAAENIICAPHPLADTALSVIEGGRRVAQSRAYLEGLVELQDAASQAVVAALPLRPGMRVLDYCAGGGGKALAMAARTGGPVAAHDADPRRMRDLPARAGRAGAAITLLSPDHVANSGPWDLVLTDVPCSGSGSWRRAPEGKWLLTAERLTELARLQDGILDRASALLGPGGVLAYATCSLLSCENGDRIAAFLARHPGWTVKAQRQFTPLDGGDGFFVAVLTREISD
ncbi:RsmB/NOP family class I SAM-dependent RNA methyltransferase [Aliigemmobacter aestuarii]|uniref:RsmB/NOP family class I SAM-dependent RNA methyltransferase n=1 Tax=Aliigemmobacter aestuarii TaxID=1445661 RepID=A0A4S3MLC2_9RHOB|nr:RsmB/NOP family class I SAM-dependent RNA methyltransferase [Gemmobacter aestuarii]THD83008.1 RsmB/NOP family class I SAM-dependent RNA methyltransferase [Gemmobacter aestuarii]